VSVLLDLGMQTEPHQRLC